MTGEEQVQQFNEQMKGIPAEEVLRFFAEKFGEKISFASSLGLEDQVIIHMLSGLPHPPSIYTLDTGRLFPETYELLQKTREKYRLNIHVYFPDRARVEEMVNEKGINLFYGSVENRQLCCHIRKIEPSRRALAGKEAWISGLRREQAVSRFATRLVEWDEQNRMLKINPLFDWTLDRVWAYIREHGVPYNVLHDKGFPSIGCQPCTRAVKEGEDVRAGRWWWEQPEKKECGLHPSG